MTEATNSKTKTIYGPSDKLNFFFFNFRNKDMKLGQEQCNIFPNLFDKCFLVIITIIGEVVKKRTFAHTVGRHVNW